jgi:hypothetical protein
VPVLAKHGADRGRGRLGLTKKRATHKKRESDMGSGVVGSHEKTVPSSLAMSPAMSLPMSVVMSLLVV